MGCNSWDPENSPKFISQGRFIRINWYKTGKKVRYKIYKIYYYIKYYTIYKIYKLYFSFNPVNNCKDVQHFTLSTTKLEFSHALKTRSRAYRRARPWSWVGLSFQSRGNGTHAWSTEPRKEIFHKANRWWRFFVPIWSFCYETLCPNVLSVCIAFCQCV